MCNSNVVIIIVMCNAWNNSNNVVSNNVIMIM
jgi:hypothetical protein